MATGWFGPCPHCEIALSYLQGVTGSTMTPKCPGCRKLVTVTRATFLVADHSGPTISLRSSSAPKKLPALP